MRTVDILNRIASACPSFGSVGHALSAPLAMTMPAAMVCPVKAVAATNYALEQGVEQHLTEVFGVYILLKRRTDGDADAGAADDLDDLRAELQAALIGFYVSGDDAPLALAGGQIDQFAPGIVTWREDFTTYRFVRVIP